MKPYSHLFFSMLIFPCVGLHAATPGSYVGAGAGYSGSGSENGATTVESGGPSGRAFWGFNFNHYLGIETNYTSIYKTKYAVTDNQYHDDFTFENKVNALSFVAKGYLPIPTKQTFNVYGLVGAAQMYSSISTKFTYMDFVKYSNKALVPTAGVGATYEVNPRFTTGLEVSGFGEKKGDYTHFGVPQTTLATLNLAYKF